ncbi:hypothetical protein AVEN_222314-1 [Araneus ventricosus]|uniref:Uncharacterized protein n=1 Tax=Araneus ventricosus TaxID=182803 RepID=A0A4Y2ERV5_ARAVE|nr:hypothetical protein AVEN_222314-1 [Araneus ventricosus]
MYIRIYSPRRTEPRKIPSKNMLEPMHHHWKIPLHNVPVRLPHVICVARSDESADSLGAGLSRKECQGSQLRDLNWRSLLIPIDDATASSLVADFRLDHRSRD